MGAWGRFVGVDCGGVVEVGFSVCSDSDGTVGGVVSRGGWRQRAPPLSRSVPPHCGSSRWDVVDVGQRWVTVAAGKAPPPSRSRIAVRAGSGEKGG